MYVCSIEYTTLSAPPPYSHARTHKQHMATERLACTSPATRAFASQAIVTISIDGSAFCSDQGTTEPDQVTI